MSQPQLVQGVLLERVGDELLVVVPGSASVLRLRGEAAKFLSDLRAGHTVDVGEAVIADLVAQGILEVPGTSRRNLLRAGAIGAGAAVSVMAMPGVVAASSSSGALPSNAINGVFSAPGVPAVLVFKLQGENPSIPSPRFPDLDPLPDENDIGNLTLSPPVSGLVNPVPKGPTIVGSQFISWEASWVGSAPAGPLVGYFMWGTERIDVVFKFE